MHVTKQKNWIKKVKNLYLFVCVCVWMVNITIFPVSITFNGNIGCLQIKMFIFIYFWDRPKKEIKKKRQIIKIHLAAIYILPKTNFLLSLRFIENARKMNHIDGLVFCSSMIKSTHVSFGGTIGKFKTGCQTVVFFFALFFSPLNASFFIAINFHLRNPKAKLRKMERV